MRNPDAGDAVGNGDARQAAAVRMRNPDAGDAVGNGAAAVGAQTAFVEHRIPCWYAVGM